MLGWALEAADAVLFDGWLDGVTVMGSLQRPKKVQVRGSDGREYNCLLKGREDLHLDERIMQLLRTVNRGADA